MIMKKLNNRQNQVKSLDLQQNILFNFSQHPGGGVSMNNYQQQQQAYHVNSGGNVSQGGISTTLPHHSHYPSQQQQLMQPSLNNASSGGLMMMNEQIRSPQIIKNAGSNNSNGGNLFIPNSSNTNGFNQDGMYYKQQTQQMMMPSKASLKNADSQKSMKNAFIYPQQHPHHIQYPHQQPAQAQNRYNVDIGNNNNGGKTLNQVESSQSFQSIQGAQAKLQMNNGLSSTNTVMVAVTNQNTGNKKLSSKATKIKIGMHKKAISIAGGGQQQILNTTTALYTKNLEHHQTTSVMHQTQQPSHLIQPNHQIQEMVVLKQQATVKNSHSRKKTMGNSGGHSKQTSITSNPMLPQKQGGSSNEYNSSNNNNIIVMNYGGDVQIFPKIDNFIIGNSPDKKDGLQRTPTSEKHKMIENHNQQQQQLMQMKNYQRMINEAAQSSAHHLKPNAKNSSASKLQQQTTESKKQQKIQALPNPLLESQNQQQMQVLKQSFDSNSRPPLGHHVSSSTTGNPSQRISIISSLLGEESQAQDAHQVPLLHTNMNLNSANIASRAQVHFQQPIQPMSMPLKNSTSTIQSQMKQIHGKFKDQDLLSALHQTSPSSQQQQHLFMSASQVNSSNANRQIKKSLQHHHQRTFSDVPNNNLAQQYSHLQHSNLLNGKMINDAMMHQHPISATGGAVNSNRGMTDQMQHSHGLSSMQSYDDNKHSSEARQQLQQHNEYQQHRKIVKNSNIPTHMQSIDATLQPNKNGLLGALQTQNMANSSRQNHSKTQSSVQQMADERDALMHILKNSNHQQSPSIHSSTDMKNIYSGLLKDQISKTKQALKLTQSQFGVTASGNGQSRKVVQSAANKLNGANTQSFRISQQGILTQMTNPSAPSHPGHMSSLSKDGAAMMLMTAGINSLQKMTPKIQLSKTKKHTKQPSINNNSSAGARGSGNATKIQNPIVSNNTGQMIYLNDAKLQKVLLQNNQSRDVTNNQKHMKAIYSAATNQHGRSESMGTGYDINLQGAMADIMARTSTKAALMSTLGDPQSVNNNFLMQAAVIASGQKLHATHKRSVSDGNTIFQSLMSGRGNQNTNQSATSAGLSSGPTNQNNNADSTPPGQIYKSTNVSSKKQKSKGNLLNNQQSHSLTRPTPPAFPAGVIIPQNDYLRSNFQKENSLTKIQNGASGPYDQILVVPQNVVTQQTLAHHENSLDRPQSGIRMNSYAMMNPSSQRSHQSNNTNKGSSHRQNEERGGHNRMRSAKNNVPSNAGLPGHVRNLSHQITIDHNQQHEQFIGSNNNMSTALPRPPTTSGKLKNPHHRRDSSSGKHQYMQPGNNGEIVIEDQGVPTPKNHFGMANTPLNMLDDQVLYDVGSAKQQKNISNGKNKTQLIKNPKKKETSSRRQSMDKKKEIMAPPSYEQYDTQDSVMTDPNLSPRAIKNMKLSRIVRLAFKRTQNPPVTSSEFYKIGKVMGKGAFGKVNLAIHRLSGKFVALKSINKTFLSEEASKRKVMQEFNILQRTRQKNIVRLYESFETPQHIVFVMEVCGAGDLLTYVRRRRKLKEDVGKHLFKQICEGLSYCHSKGILHRDIKLDNILLTSEGDIKICDFGVSKLTKPGEPMKEQCGTPAYIAPEVFEGQGYEGYASDIWSAGVVLYAMLYGTVPFKASNMTELQRQICKGSTSFKEEISQESINLLQAILEKDPKKRLSINEILKHPWMQNIPANINVFTDQEKDKVNQEFAYYNMKGDNNAGEGDNPLATDPFAEHMSLNSTQNSLVKNVSTKSVILAPFNSTRTHIDENFHNHDSIQDLMIDKRVIKFAAKVKEVDRQYEANNNAELDNGVYHQDEEEEKKDEGAGAQQQAQSPAGVGAQDEYQIMPNRQDDDQLQKEIEKGQKLKDQSEWQKIERMMINKQRHEGGDESKGESQMNLALAQQQLHNQNANMVIEQQVLSEIEVNGGFPQHFTTACLKNDDLNYTTAYYYLLCTIKEY